jgi:hypothetical protein
VPETAFIRLPHPKHMLTAPNFNLLPNKVRLLACCYYTCGREC